MKHVFNRYSARTIENSEEKGGSFDASGAFHGPGSGWSDEDDASGEGRGMAAGQYRKKSYSPAKVSQDK